MSSILTNSSAMNALATLKDVNRGLNQTQDRVSTGLKVASGKDNAAYFAVSETMKGDSGMFKAINEGMTATKNSVATARLGAETVSDIAQQIVERVALLKPTAWIALTSSWKSMHWSRTWVPQSSRRLSTATTWSTGRKLVLVTRSPWLTV